MLQPDRAIVTAVHDVAQGGGYDQVTLILTATGIILAALGVIFAVASVVLGAFAIFGYNDFKRMMKEQNEKMMQEFFAQYPTPQQLKDDLFSGVTGADSATIPPMQTSNEGVELAQAPTEAVGKPYPESPK